MASDGEGNSNVDERRRVRELILAVDAGSSSVRCSAYEFFPRGGGDSDDDDDVADGGGAGDGNADRAESDSPPPLVLPLEKIRCSVPFASVIPNSGRVRVPGVLDAVDGCIDGALRCLRESNDGGDASLPFRVVTAVAFSAFVMNLVGMDDGGNPVGECATASYACNRPEISEECRELRRKLGPDGSKAMYRRTGAPIHAAYGLPQLCAFYRRKNDDAEGEGGSRSAVHKWQTIPSACIGRWTGRGSSVPISFSEASWTGMMDVRTCRWDRTALRYLAEAMASDGNGSVREAADALPDLIDFDDGGFHPALADGIPPELRDGEKNPYWDRWPELRGRGARRDGGGCRLFLGVGDGAAANVGSKCCGGSSLSSKSNPTNLPSDGNRIAVTIGTSAAARICLPLPISPPDEHDAEDIVIDGEGGAAKGNENDSKGSVDRDIVITPGLFCYRVDKSRVLLGGALTDGGSLVEWCRSFLNLHSDKDFDACLAEASQLYFQSIDAPPAEGEGLGAAAGSGGGHGGSGPATAPHSLTVIPFLSGERSTGFRDGAKGCVSGITRQTTPAQFLKSCLEAVVLRIDAVLTLIREASSTTRAGGGCIVASGTALERNALWRTMLADRSGLDVLIDADAGEGTSRGVAILAAQSLVADRRRRGRRRGRDGESGGVVADSEVSYQREELNVLDRTNADGARLRTWERIAAEQERLIEVVSPTWDSS